MKVGSQRSAPAATRWIDRWLDACHDLAELSQSNPMTDAVIDEIDGRMIRIGDAWLADFASCNYLGFDLDREIIDAVPGYLERWGTHPSWSRLLGSPVLYEEIEERLTELLGAEDTLLLPTITLIHMSVIPVLAGGGTIFLEKRAHKTIYEGCQLAEAHGATVKPFAFEDVEDLERLLRGGSSAPRLICIDGVNSMTGNAADIDAFARLAREYDALLYVDDAHGFGVIGERSADETSPYGSRGNGIMRYFGESYDHVLFVAGLSKSYSSLAAFLACPQELKRLLKTAAPPYLYSGTVADRFARDDAGRARGQRSAGATRSAPISGARRQTVLDCLDRLGAHTPNSSGFPIIEVPLGPRRGHRRGRPLPVRERRSTSRSRPTRSFRGARSASGFRSPRRTPTPRSSSSSTCSASSRTDSTSSQPKRGSGQHERAERSGARISLGVVRSRSPARCRPLPLRSAADGLRAAHQCRSASRASSRSSSASGCTSPRARIAWWLFARRAVPLLQRRRLHVQQSETPSFPSLGDALYLAVYPVLMAGLFVLVRRRNPRRDRAALIDALILTIGIGLLSWVFLIAPNIHLGRLSWLAKGVSVAYPLGDVLLLAGAIRLAVDAGKRAPAFYLLAGSIVCLLATDSAYNYALLKGTYDHAS